MMRRLWERRKVDFSQELDSHLRMAISEGIANGESPEEARAAAMRELGNVPLIEDVTRARWGWLWLEHISQDLRYALRQLGRARGFGATVVLTIAFGIGCNLAVFQLLYSVILADLPVAHPEELFAIHAARTPFDEEWLVSYPAYQRLRASTASDVPILARAYGGDADMEIPGEAVTKARTEMVSDNYFSVLGATPLAGRFFTSRDAQVGQSEWPVVVSYGFARDHFVTPEQAVGKHVVLNGIHVVIVGVTDRRFLGVITGFATDFWLPLELQTTAHFRLAWDSLGPGHAVELGKPWQNQPTIFWLSLISRIPAQRRNSVLAQWDHVFCPDRVLMTEATADPAAKSALLSAKMQIVPADHGQGGIRQQSFIPLALLMSLSASIFLVGCLNLANLQVARLFSREQELGIRMALGASWWRLQRQILIEDALLVLLGGVAAFLIGRAASGVLVHWASSRGWPLTISLQPGVPVATLGIALMVLALLAFGMVPAFHFIRTSLSRSASSGSKVSGLSSNARHRWQSNAMLVGQVSLSLLLATMSGCFAATLVHWETIDLGIDSEHILSAMVDMDQPRYTEAKNTLALPALYARIKERLEALPGVSSAAVEVCRLPDCGWNTALYASGSAGLSNPQVHGKEDHVGPGFFRTMGIPLMRGRDFSSADTIDTQTVVIVSHAYARQLFRGADPVGHFVGYGPAPNDHAFLIIGEAADARIDGPKSEPPATAYLSLTQRLGPAHSILVREIGHPRELAERVHSALLEVDPSLPIERIVPMTSEFNDGLNTEKLIARLAAVYAGLTLLLVAIGFYGVMSSRTARRRTEFGVRLALGATRQNIQFLVVGWTARILIAGIVPGLLLSVVAIRLASHVLFGSVTANSLSIVAAAAALALAGIGATFIPARRAALSDPIDALRSE